MSTSSSRRLGPCLAWLLLLWAGPRALAQEIDWHQDYTWARSLAASTGRPLILSISGPTCVECVRLHGTTFRDRGVAGTIGQIFIAVKIDVDRDAALVQAMGVTSFPVVVLAAADGTVLHSFSGYVDASQMTEHLNLALTRLQRYREGIRPGSEPPPGPAPQAGPARTPPMQPPTPVAPSGQQRSQSYYPPPTWSAPQPTTWGGSPYSYSQGQPSGSWTNPYLSGQPSYFATPRRC